MFIELIKLIEFIKEDRSPGIAHAQKPSFAMLLSFSL